MTSVILSVTYLPKTFLAQIVPSQGKTEVSKAKTSDKECEEKFQEYESIADGYKFSDTQNYSKVYKEFIQKYPFCPQISEAWWRIGRRFEQRHDLVSAIKAYKNGAKIVNKPYKWFPIGHFSRKAMSSLARIYLKQNDLKGLINVLSDMKKKFPNYFESEIEEVISFFKRKNKEVRGFEEDLFSFLKLLKKNLSYEPSTRIYLFMGKNFESYKDLAKSLEMYKRAADPLILSVFEKALYHLAALYEFKLSDYSNAILTYQEILEKFPEKTSCNVFFDGCLQCDNASIKKRLELKTHIADLYKDKMGDYQKALEIYQEVVTECEGFDMAEEVKDKLGKVYEIQHRYLEAAKVYEESKNLEKHLISAYFYIRYGNLGKGDFDQARKVLLKAIELCKNPHYYSHCFERVLSKINVVLSALGNKKFKKVVRDYSFANLDFLHLLGTNVTIAYNGKDLEILQGKFDQFSSFRVEGFALDSGSPALRYKHNETEVVFLNPSETIRDKFLVDEIFNFPKGFLKGLQVILVSSKPSPPSLKRRLGGYYIKDERGGQEKNLLVIYRHEEGKTYRRSIGENIHELMHHWDFSVTKGPKDPSKIYYSISWSYDLQQKGYRRISDDSDEFFVKYQATHDYPMFSPSEDFACAGASYFISPQEFRDKIRKNMEKGKFELAVKYLFIKYVTPWEGKEFGVTKDNPGLDFMEVEERLNETLTRNPGSVRVTTIKALEKIKKIYRQKQDWGCGGCAGCLK